MAVPSRLPWCLVALLISAVPMVSAQNRTTPAPASAPVPVQVRSPAPAPAPATTQITAAVEPGSGTVATVPNSIPTGYFQAPASSSEAASWLAGSNNSNPFEIAAQIGRLDTWLVTAWLNGMKSNPALTTGNVRWTSSSCSAGSSSCDNTVPVQVMEWSYNTANDPSQPLDCGAHIVVGIAASYFPVTAWAKLPNGQMIPANSGMETFVVHAAQTLDSNGKCFYVVTQPDFVIAAAAYVTTPNGSLAITSPGMTGNISTSGRHLLQFGGPCAGAAGAVLGAAAGCAAVGAFTFGLGGAACALGIGGAALSGGIDAGIGCSQQVKNSGCFPGHAQVMLEGGDMKYMQQLRMGNRVQVADSKGNLGFDDIFVFGEKDANTLAPYIQMTLKQVDTDRLFTLEASPDHFMLSGHSMHSRLSMRAKDVKPGHVMWTQAASGLQAALVENVSLVYQQGLFNPYTAAGTIVVNGVAATVHSRWFLDSAFDVLGLTAYLPQAYQVAMTPVWVLYNILKFIGGPSLAESCDSFFQLSTLGHNYPITFVAANTAAFGGAMAAAGHFTFKKLAA